MKIIISDIPDDGMEIELSETVQSDAVKTTTQVKASLRIERSSGEALVRGRVSGGVELQCSRCLNYFTATLNAPVDVVYDPADVIVTDENHEIKGDELDMGFYTDDTLDLDDLLVEQLLLNLPMKPLCSPDCKGICQRCGADINVTQCNCLETEPDPRLKVLEQLLKRKE
jgi:uncharacterized protein